MNVLDLRLKGARAIFKSHPTLRGMPKIGRGAFAVVYDAGETVMKLTVDQHQYDFLRSSVGSSNPVFPTVIVDHGKVGEINGAPAFLMEIEKLKPVPEGSFACEFVDSFIDSFVKEYPVHEWATNTECCAEALIGMSDHPAYTRHMKAGLLDLAEFILEKNCVSDFHRENFMLRGSQIILNDPVADHYAQPIW